MAQMASPWKHPATGVFYLRRQIPERLRAAFDGKALFKASLGTKVASEATVLFLQANAALEQRFEEARLRLKATGSPCPTDRDRADELVGAYFEGPERTPDVHGRRLANDHVSERVSRGQTGVSG